MIVSLRVSLRKLEGKGDISVGKRDGCPFAENCSSCIQSYACNDKLQSMEKGVNLVSLDNGDILVGKHQYTWEEWVNLCEEVLGQENYWKLNKDEKFSLQILKLFAYWGEKFSSLKLPFEAQIIGILKNKTNPIRTLSSFSLDIIKGEFLKKRQVHLNKNSVVWGQNKISSENEQINDGKNYNLRWNKVQSYRRPPPVLLR
jgi:hypothetical protein